MLGSVASLMTLWPVHPERRRSDGLSIEALEILRSFLAFDFGSTHLFAVRVLRARGETEDAVDCAC